MKQIAPDFKILAAPYKEFTFDEQIGFKKKLDGLKADLVHFGMVQQPITYQGRVVTTMHDLTTLRFKNPSKNPVVFKAKQEVYAWVNKRAAHKSAAIIVPTEFVKRDVAQYTHIDPAKIFVTYESADPIHEPPKPVPGVVGKHFILYVGRPMPHKNLPRLIEAFRKIRLNQPDLHLVLAGKTDANYRRILQNLQHELNTNIICTDFVDDGQLRWLYMHSAAYVFPSLSEGFGLPGLEAMLHHCPVASSNATCLPEVYGDAAHYFDPRDVDDMAAKITEVLTDEALRASLIKAGDKQIKKYSWSHMARQTLEIYQKALLS